MPLELLRKIWKEIRDAGLSVRWLHEMGEPLLYPHLSEALNLFPEAILSTHGNQLRGDVAALVIKSPIRHVRICLDTLDPDRYSIIRRGGSFDSVIDNIKEFLVLSKGKSIEVQIQKLVSKLTKHETRKQFERYFNLANYPHARVIEKTCEGLDTSDETDLHTAYSGCFQGGPFNWLVILADGSVTHCCYDFEGRQAIGNMNSDCLEDIASSPALSDIHRAFKEKDFSRLPRCAECFKNREKAGAIPAWVYRWLRRLPFKDRFRKLFT